MKYWIFQNNEVCGPYDANDLAQLPGYSAETLVCPEGRKGTRLGDWQRAATVPGLSSSMVKTTQLDAMGKNSFPASARHAGLPPEPTNKDLTSLGSLQEKVTLLENSIAQFQAGMKSFELRLAAVAQLRETIDNAVALEKSVETEVKSVESEVKGVESTVQEVKSSITGVSSMVKDIETSLDKQRQSVSDLMADVELLKSPRTSTPSLPPKTSTAPPMMTSASLYDRQDGVTSAPPPTSFQIDAPPPGLSAPPPASFQIDAPPPGLSVPPPVPLFPGHHPPALLSGLPPGGPTTRPAGTSSKLVISDMAADQAQPKSGKKGLVLALVGFGLVAGGALAFQAGLIPGRQRPPRRANPTATIPLTPPPAITPPAPSPEAQLEEFKHQAIDLVKNWPSSDKVTLIGQRLEASVDPGKNPALSWMAEKLGEGTFQVNFYGGKSPAGKQTIYMFQANLGEKTVTPYDNDATAKALLFGEPPAARRRKVRVKPKQPAAAKTPTSRQEPSARGLPGMFEEKADIQPVTAPESGSTQKSTASGDEAAAALEQMPKPARKAPRRQAGEGKQPAKPADDAQLLDKLLE